MALNKNLTSRLRNCNSEEEILEVLNSFGYAYSKQQLNIMNTSSNRELSDDELDMVTGGSLAGELFQEVFSVLFKVGKNKFD